MDSFKVLLIDDESELVETLVERLGYRGVTAKYTTSGREALRMMTDEVFDIIVLDLKMPGMSGEEVLKEMKNRNIETPVLLITGHGAPIDEMDEKIDGVADYLAKPISLEELIAKMKESIRSE